MISFKNLRFADSTCFRDIYHTKRAFIMYTCSFECK